MEHVKAWGALNTKTGLWRRDERVSDQPMWSLNKDDKMLTREAAACDQVEVAEIPDDYTAGYPYISEAMIRRAEMLYWDVKISRAKIKQ